MDDICIMESCSKTTVFFAINGRDNKKMKAKTRHNEKLKNKLKNLK
jgi:hypothetical protein